MTSQIRMTESVVEVDNVSDVIITDIVQAESGEYVREIRIMTKAEGEETQTRSFVLRLSGALADTLHVSAPSSEF